MRKFCFLAVVLFGAVLVAGAQFQLPPNQTVVVDFDRSANYVNYKTYKWVSIPSDEQLDELTTGQLIGTFQVELAKKGLTNTTADDPDLFIGYQVSNASQKPLKSYNIGVSYGSVGGASATGSASATVVHTGQLMLLMFDASKKQLIWRGIVANAIDADTKPETKQKHLTNGIEKLLKRYPPPAPK
jgi:Domain of unknown function (DUF4136)